MNAYQKLDELKKIIREMGSVMIALSGGVDSTFLLKVSRDVLKSKAVAATAVSVIYPEWEIREAGEIAESLGAEHIRIEIDAFNEIENLIENPVDRCYYCKKTVFSRMIKEAEARGINNVVDGTNTDDLVLDKPGTVALRELGVKSPLAMANLRKEEIRELSNAFGLTSFNKPAYPCLVTRIPHGEKVSEDKLRMIDKAEEYIIGKGIRNVRVRCHGNLARVEVDKKDFIKFTDDDFNTDIIKKLRSLGFKFISLDIAGYVKGSMD